MKKILYMWMALMPCLLGACSENDEVNSELKTAVTKAGSLETVEITLETAGTLAEKLGDKAATTEKLILSGPVDADDVTTFRGMKNLVSLDIKGVEFVESDKKYGDSFVKKETISRKMFMYLKLKELILPENIRVIESSAFLSLPIKTIDLPSTVEKIEGSAFQGCSSLESIVISDGVSVIESNTFCDCRVLQSVVLPQKLESIGLSAFINCRSLAAIDIPETVVELGESAFSGTGLKSITIPEKVKAIPQACFYNCKVLETVVLPSKLVTIGKRTFQSCSLLTSLDIPESVTELGEGVFNSSGLKSTTIPKNVKVIPEACFAYCEDLETVVLPSGLTTIGGRAFDHCHSLGYIGIPETVNVIGSSAFVATGITSVTLPENLATITSHCFAGCTSLTEVKLPDNLAKIQGRAFESCPSLKVIDVPQKTQVIESGAFNDCLGIEAVFVKGKTKVGDLFWNEQSNSLIYLSDPDSEVASQLHNVVYNGVAPALVLSGDGAGSTFFCHQSFKAQKITFTKAFNLDYFGAFPSSGRPAGWAAISLPFSVDKITAADGRVLAPFRAEVADAKPFWLRKLTSNGFENVTRMEAGEPYIIAMPYDERYDAEYNVRGTVTFTAQDFTNGILIPETTYRTASGPEYDFNANYEIRPRSASYYVLNTYDHVEGYKQGGVFVRSLRATYPFEPYVTNKSGVANVSKVFGIGPSVQTRAKHTVGSKPSIDDK